MAIPRQDELYNIVLEALKSGAVHDLDYIRRHVKLNVNMTRSESLQKLSSGRELVWHNRLGWSLKWLKDAGLLIRPRKAHYQITEAGRKFLSNDRLLNKSIIEELIAHRMISSDSAVDSPLELDEDDEPLKKFDKFERLYLELEKNFIDDLLKVILNLSSEKFEGLIDRLLRTLDYDGEEFVDVALKSDKNGNLSGSLMLRNRSGFDVRHVEAKRLPYDEVIDEDELQRFVKAMDDRSQIKKGMFLATAMFSDEAKEYADEHSVYLLDVDDVINLMLDHNLGVTTRTYELKYIDKKFFMG